VQHLEYRGALHEGGRRAHHVICGARALVERHEMRGDDRGHPDARKNAWFLEESEEGLGRGQGRGRGPTREVGERAREHEGPTPCGENIVREEIRPSEYSRGAVATSAATVNFCDVRYSRKLVVVHVCGAGSSKRETE
jgi:hypothetical protein